MGLPLSAFTPKVQRHKPCISALSSVSYSSELLEASETQKLLTYFFTDLNRFMYDKKMNAFFQAAGLLAEEKKIHIIMTDSEQSKAIFVDNAKGYFFYGKKSN